MNKIVKSNLNNYKLKKEYFLSKKRREIISQSSRLADKRTSCSRLPKKAILTQSMKNQASMKLVQTLLIKSLLAKQVIRKACHMAVKTRRPTLTCRQFHLQASTICIWVRSNSSKSRGSQSTKPGVWSQTTLSPHTLSI